MPEGIVETLPRANHVPRPNVRDRETTWSKWLAYTLAARREAVTFSGARCDVLTSSHAIEVEWISKWPEAIGQSLLYSIEHGRRPAIVLLRRNNLPTKYLARCRMVCFAYQIELYTLDTTDPAAFEPVRIV